MSPSNKNNTILWEFQKGKRKRTESIFKVKMAGNLPKLGKEMEIQILVAQRTLNRWSLNRAKPRCIIIKFEKSKTKNEF